jgi:hypothetical protein
MVAYAGHDGLSNLEAGTQWAAPGLSGGVKNRFEAVYSGPGSRYFILR